MQKNSKNLKTTFPCYFQQERDEIGRERDKIIFDPNSAHTRPGGENCKKKKAKKFKKLKNNFPALVLAKTGLDRMRQAKKQIKECKTRIPLILDPGEKIQKKKIKKNSKN